MVFCFVQQILNKIHIMVKLVVILVGKETHAV